MSKQNEIEYLIIKQEKTPEEKLKWQIESDLFYLCECKHCMIVFLVEESADHFKNIERPDRIALKCPVCHTDNLIPKTTNRLKLQLDRIIQPTEISPYYKAIIERSKKGGARKQ